MACSVGSTQIRRLCQHLAHRRAGALDIRLIHRIEHRQRDDLFADMLGDREHAFLEAPRPVQCEQVNRRVVVADADVVLFHARHELGTGDALRQHDLEQVPVGAFIIFRRQLCASLRLEILAERFE